MKCQGENAKNAQKDRKNELYHTRSCWIFCVYKLLVLNCFSGISCDFLQVRDGIHLAKRIENEILFGKLHKICTRILANPPKFPFPLYKCQKMYYNIKDENCVIAARKNQPEYYKQYYSGGYSTIKNVGIMYACP